MARIFLSYSSKNEDFVRNLAADLNKLKHTIWLDKWEIRVGDSVITKIEGAIDEADFVAVVLSKNSTSSGWVEKEWQAKYWEEITKRKVMVLPLLLEDCTIPPLLRPKKYADFRSNYKTGLVELAISLQPRQEFSGIIRYFSDFVGITNDWLDLFNHTIHLDLLVMYAATWRNTYLKNIKAILAQPHGRLRVLLPEVRGSHPLLQLYAERLKLRPTELRERVITAIDDFNKLSTLGQVEIYTTARYFTHACYLFDSGGILALYSYKTTRVPTPAFILQDGDLLNFLRQDFDWLILNKELTQRVI